MRNASHNTTAEIAVPKGWRREVFGRDALRLKRGELALMLDGAQVKVPEAPRA